PRGGRAVSSLLSRSTPPPPPRRSPLSLHDALPICRRAYRAHRLRVRGTGAPPRPCTADRSVPCRRRCKGRARGGRGGLAAHTRRSEEHTSELQSLAYLVCRPLLEKNNSILEVQQRL